MNSVYLPEGYKARLSLFETQKAIGLTKRLFEDTLAGRLCLRRVSPPLFVEASTGLNDDLNGVERAVTFDVPAAGRDAQVVHSLAKWKRYALHEYGFAPGTGLYADMNAIRRDEDMDNLHSIYVDQWDWEKVITEGERNTEYLKATVRDIVACICDTQLTLRSIFPLLVPLGELRREVTFITSEELLGRYPGLNSKERENAIAEECGTVFIVGIGGKLSSGEPHDSRAPDYDDWSMNGDLIFWSGTLGRAMELSSMGVRVDPAAMDRQLTLAGCDSRRGLKFHKMLLENRLPLSIGGGIGQSRLCMLLLGSAHIGEVQVSVWDDETRRVCAGAGIHLL